MSEYVRLSLLVTMLCSMSVVETIFAKRTWITLRFKRIAFHSAISLVNTGLIRLLVMTPFLILLDYSNQHQLGLRHYLSLDGALEVACTVIVFDMFNYGWHRMNHEIPFFWHFHRYHHMDIEMDSTTALRFSPVELCLSYAVKAVWVIVWGPSVVAFVIFETLITMYSLFHHSNIDLGDKWERIVRKVHMTPRLHAAHHTLTRRTRDANYSTIFLIWDRVFGTLKDASAQELKELGTSEARNGHLSVKNYFLSMVMKIK